MRALAVAAIVVAGCVAGCVDKGPGPQGKKVDPTYVASHVLKAAPGDLTRKTVALGGKVIYLGNKLDKPAVAPGGTIRVTHYWQVLQPVGTDWKAFALVRGAPNTADFMNLPATDMELAHGPAVWRPGEIIEDIQDITLRPDWKSPTATLLVGLIDVGSGGGHAIGDRMIAAGDGVQDRAIVARVLEVDLSKAPPPPGTIYVPRATTPITIDGAATEPGWLTAVTSPEFATGEGSSDPIGKATAKLTWDDQNLYLFVSVTDSDIVSPYKKHDDSLWKADCVEMFVDADGNRHGYVELQVNPNNVTFDSWFATTRAQPGDPSWDSGMQTAVKVRGTTEAGDTDQGWDAEVAIPWAAVKGRDEAMKVELPPHVGDRWRLNVVRVDHKTGEKAGESAVASWNRITIGDFHALDRMLTVVFADSAGSINPNAPPPPPPPVPATPPGAGSGSASSGNAVFMGASGSATMPEAAPGTGSSSMAPRGTGSGATTMPIAPRAGSGATTMPIAPRVGSDATTMPIAPRAGSGATTMPIAPRAGSGATTMPIAPRAGSGATTMPIAPRAGSGATTMPVSPATGNDPARRAPTPGSGSGSGSGSGKRPIVP